MKPKKNTQNNIGKEHQINKKLKPQFHELHNNFISMNSSPQSSFTPSQVLIQHKFMYFLPLTRSFVKLALSFSLSLSGLIVTLSSAVVERNSVLEVAKQGKQM